MFKNVLFGLGTALAGFVVTLILGMLWLSAKASNKADLHGPGPPGEQGQTVSFSLMGFINHFWWFWWLIHSLALAGFLFSYWRQTRTG